MTQKASKFAECSTKTHLEGDRVLDAFVVEL